jgi:hypothetical protein
VLFQICALLLRAMDEHLVTRFNSVSSAVSDVRALLLRAMAGMLITRFNSVSSAVSDLRAVTTCDGRYVFCEGEQCDSQHLSCF